MASPMIHSRLVTFVKVTTPLVSMVLLGFMHHRMRRLIPSLYYQQYRPPALRSATNDRSSLTHGISITPDISSKISLYQICTKCNTPSILISTRTVDITTHSQCLTAFSWHIELFLACFLICSSYIGLSYFRIPHYLRCLVFPVSYL